jgi:hypothetical protein
MRVRIRRVPNITLAEVVVRAFVLLLARTNQRRDEISSARRGIPWQAYQFRQNEKVYSNAAF